VTEHYTAMDIDPRRLLLAKQVRADAATDAALVASIRDRGVLQPIVVTEDDPDQFTVLAGHRRTIAAIEAGLALVPITVVASRDEKNRIVDQLAENDHRASLTRSDRMDAFEQLALIGLSADQIATMTASPTEEVEQLRKVRNSPVAELARTSPGLSLVDLAAIADFEGHQLERLLQVAADAPERIGHEIDSAIIRRNDERSMAAAIAELEAAGHTAEPEDKRDWGASPSLMRLGLTPAEHADCPGRILYVSLDHEWVDGSWTIVGYDTTECCLQAELHRPQSATIPTQPAVVDDEARKADRRRIIRLNKQWWAAQQTRRDWVKARGFARKWTGADQYVATAVTYQRTYLDRYGIAGIVEEFLGLEPARWDGPREVPAAMTAAGARAQTLGVLAAAGEADLPDDGWREPNAHRLGGIYLRLLEANGYPLCHTERLAAGYTDDKDPDDE